MYSNKKLLTLIFLFFFIKTYAEDGYDLWLRYVPVKDKMLLKEYQNQIKGISISGNSATINAAKEELDRGLSGLLNKNIPFSKNGNLIIGLSSNTPFIASLKLENDLQTIGNEGFIIISTKNNIVITANTEGGVLYGVFHFLRLIQTGQSLKNLKIIEKPKVKHRILNHWDNLNRHVERGYAGQSIWDWHRLPDYIDPRYKDYARANASIGINGVSPINVNANAQTLTPQYLVKVKALADVFRPYGIKMYLTARFSAPIEIGNLKTADPLDPIVQKWWKDKADEIYTYIPDFGGFLVKANSEGQPGPQNYGRNHADGANMLADAVAPHGGIVMWRAFVYSADVNEDRHKHANNEFVPLDGQFRKNVIVQVKNGAIDFQPREPFHPLFGAMPKTPIMPEFQITHEYLGQATHLVYSGTLFKETLDADTYAKGKGSTVAKVMDGSLDGHDLTGVAGVANIGSDRNWCGHPFLQSNWYAFGRLAWNYDLKSEDVADEWLKQTFSLPQQQEAILKQIMMDSRENMVNYMTPLGLHHIMTYGSHYGPAPWVDFASRPDWNCIYYHRADSVGLGFDRTATGSDAISQYAPTEFSGLKTSASAIFSDLKTCPDEYLLWFHHIKWDYKMRSGKTLWDEMASRYYKGVESVRTTQKTWETMRPYVDNQRFEQVKMLLNVQEKEAVWWRNACLLYFQTFSKMPIPFDEKPDKTLEYYKSLKFPYAPGNG